MLITFLFYISWIVFPISAIWLILFTVLATTYTGSIAEMKDKIRGVRRTYP